MAVGILCATFSEVTPFWKRMDVASERKVGMLEFKCGTLAGKDVVVACSGICKTNAAMATQIMISQFGVEAILNAGAAGGVVDSVELFDVVISDVVVHHDVEGFLLVESYPYYETYEYACNERLLQCAHAAAPKSDQRFLFGKTATGECFVDDSNRDGIVEKCAPLAVDMETASMAQVCHAQGMPFMAVRCITDTPALSGFNSYEKHAVQAAEYACDATELILQEM